MESTIEKELECQAKKLEISIKEEQIVLLKKFQKITQKTNCQFNLVSRKGNQEDLILNQILDSLLLQPILRIAGPKKVLDLGSGGGFPGVPLSILNPDIHFDFLDSSRKRFNHLLNIKMKLGLTNSNPIHERAENHAKTPQHRAFYDLITAKAVTDISTLVKWARPLIKSNGILLTSQGESKTDEIWELMKDEGRQKGIQIRSLDGGLGGKRRNRLIWMRVGAV